MAVYAPIPANVQITVFILRFQPQTCRFRLTYIDNNFPNGSLIESGPNIFDWYMPDQGQEPAILQGSAFIQPRPTGWSFGVDSAFVNYPPEAAAPPVLVPAPASHLYEFDIPQQGQGPGGVNSRVRVFV
jgi:hypothetical protein